MLIIINIQLIVFNSSTNILLVTYIIIRTLSIKIIFSATLSLDIQTKLKEKIIEWKNRIKCKKLKLYPSGGGLSWMESVRRVQILNKADWVSLCTNAHRKSMNPSILSSVKDKIVRQTGFISLGKATILGDDTLWNQTSCWLILTACQPI